MEEKTAIDSLIESLEKSLDFERAKKDINNYQRGFNKGLETAIYRTKLHFKR